MPDRAPPLPGEIQFDQRNAFLDFLLGVISVSERTLSTVVDLAEPAPPIRVTPCRPPPDGPILR